MTESSLRTVTDDERERERIVDELDVRGEPGDADPALMSPQERRQAAAKVMYSLARMAVTYNEMLVTMGRLTGLSEDETTAIIEAGEADALRALGLDDDDEDFGEADRPT
jgi:hypothetical protein